MPLTTTTVSLSTPLCHSFSLFFSTSRDVYFSLDSFRLMNDANKNMLHFIPGCRVSIFHQQSRAQPERTMRPLWLPLALVCDHCSMVTENWCCGSPEEQQALRTSAPARWWRAFTFHRPNEAFYPDAFRSVLCLRGSGGSPAYSCSIFCAVVLVRPILLSYYFGFWCFFFSLSSCFCAMRFLRMEMNGAHEYKS